MKKIMLLLVTLLASGELFSQTDNSNKQQDIRYIRDQLLVPLRSGQSNQHRIVHKGLLSGTPVTVLEISEDQTYSLVRTRKGTEGWIQTQYLNKDPAARDLLEVANKKLEKLQQQNTALDQKLKDLRSEHKQAEQQLSSVNEDYSQTEQELEEIKAISAKAIQLNSDNQRLLNDNQLLKNEIEVLRTDNQRLSDNQDSDAFLNGAFAVLIGVMIALLVPRLSPKKRTDWA
ncbi:TIGR04211 family SH3 domain-containing protein [Oceanicoccus sp. KOV_DT_Chl]|uniref:TIGR04211 family SH3 domain-containing protein n=1 Tax=Oceanicoccus sp. KOV_DT_Chl TaxID=1904639 RepID=UPI001F2CD31E|nr:TIGR04211 family SH3 domain-containing protein [Oceanicoccus sp. KOV_DT_Chl]